MKTPLFIAFTGSACSGKTTIVNQLYNILNVNYNVYCINEIVRDTISDFNMSLDEIIDNPNILYEFQSKNLSKQIKIEQQLLTSDYDIVISDRSVYDYFVYSMIGLTPDLYNKFKQEFSNVVNNYDMLVYCDFLGFKDDNFRSKKHIERGEVGLFQMIVKPYASHVLNSNPHWKRMKLLLKWLEPKLEGVK